MGGCQGWLGWALCGAWLALAAAALALLLLGGPGAVPLVGPSAAVAGLALAAFLVYQAVGTLVLSDQPRHPIGWLFCALGLSAAFVAFARAYTSSPLGLPGGALVAWLWNLLTTPTPFLLGVLLPLLFPTGRLPSPRWRPVAALAAGGCGLVLVAQALTPGPLRVAPTIDNPFGLASLSTSWLDVLGVGMLALPICTLAAALSVVVRLRRAHGHERQQLKWFASAAVVAAICVAVFFALARGGGPQWLLQVPLSLAYASLAVAVGVALLRYRLYDIDLLVHRALVYAALSAAVVGVYVLVVAGIGALFRTGDNLLVSLLATALVAVLFQPLRLRLQRAVSRLLYGERDDPYAVLARLDQRLAATLTPDSVLPTLAATLCESLKLPYAAVALESDDPLPAAECGQSAADVACVALRYQGVTVGHLLLGRRAPGEAFSRADQRLLEDLAHHAGAAVHGARAMAALQHARERLVLAREEERRRLRRDLHDELGPSLASLGLAVATIGELLPAEPAAAARVASKLEGAIRATVGDVRRLVYDLRPPLLDELGLAGALTAHLADQDAAGLAGGAGGVRIQVELPRRLPTLPAAVEVAAYRIVQEAVTNVRRHARANRCVVRLACAGGGLRVEVVDDGVGPPAPDTLGERSRWPGSGVGLRTMAERAAELGGTFRAERAAPRGTQIVAWLPLPGSGQLPREDLAWTRSAS